LKLAPVNLRPRLIFGRGTTKLLFGRPVFLRV